MLKLSLRLVVGFFLMQYLLSHANTILAVIAHGVTVGVK